MELYEEQSAKNINPKMPKVIGICIVILIILTIAIIYGIVYLKGIILTVKVDEVKNSNIEQILYFKDNDKTKLYIPIRKIAKFLGYEDYRGDYKIKSEDDTKCYVKNDYEIAMFSMDSNTLIKTRGDSDYEYIQLDEKVFEKDGELYTTPTGIEKAFNTLVEYDSNSKKIDIYTMDYLNQYYASKLKIGEYSTSTSNTEQLSKEFSDKKAIFEKMIIFQKDKLYGVINASTGKSVLETKYEEIKYLPATSDFLVKSNGKYGVLSKDASVKVRIVYDEIKIMDNQNGLYLVKQNNLYGVVNTDGKVIIAPEYKQIGIDITKYAQNGVENQYVLLDEIIPIKNNIEQWALFNIKGEKIKDFELSGIGSISNSNDNIYSAVVIPSYKMIIVEKDKHYNLITTKGEEIFKNNEKTINIEEWLAKIGK